MALPVFRSLAIAVGFAVFGASSAVSADDATPSRKSLLPLVQPLWSELSSAQQEVLKPFEPQWNALPLEEKRAWRNLAVRFPRMQPAEQAKARERIGEWAGLTPEQRRLARQNYRLAKQIPAEARKAQWESYQTLTAEQQEVLRTAGSTSNTAARHAGSRTALAKQANQPIIKTAERISPKPLGPKYKDNPVNRPVVQKPLTPPAVEIAPTPSPVDSQP
jgi:hypothetical protein